MISAIYRSQLLLGGDALSVCVHLLTGECAWGKWVVARFCRQEHLQRGGVFFLKSLGRLL
jgi:hypothetical protein